MKTAFWVILFILFFVAFAGIIYDFNISHEKVHKIIAEMYGGQNCITNVSLIHQSYMKCESYKNRTLETVMEENKMHIMNEIQGYNNGAILMTLFLCTMILAIIFVMVIDSINSIQGGNNYE